jgi:hypothetical protein
MPPDPSRERRFQFSKTAAPLFQQRAALLFRESQNYQTIRVVTIFSVTRYASDESGRPDASLINTRTMHHDGLTRHARRR